MMKRIIGAAACVAIMGITGIVLAAMSAWQDPQQEAAPDAASRPAENAKRTVLITGANRGLGLEFARQYHDRGYNVIGTARTPDSADALNALGVRVEQLDVTSAESVAALVKSLGDLPIDLLINNAGVGGHVRALAEFDIKDVERTIQVNLVGPMRVTDALLDNVRAGKGKMIVNITSGLGSIENNTWGGIYGYRESKAGLNMYTRSLAADLKDEGFICIVMSPGWVKTDMGGPNANLTPKESIGGMIGVIDKLTAEDSGKFWRYNGEQMAW